MTTISPRLGRSPTEAEKVAHMVRRIERQIVFQLLDELLNGGYELRVWDGEDWACDRGRNKQTIFASMFSVEEESLRVYKPGEPAYFASIYLVYGNDGYDVIADNSVVLEDHIAQTTALAERLADEVH